MYDHRYGMLCQIQATVTHIGAALSFMNLVLIRYVMLTVVHAFIQTYEMIEDHVHANIYLPIIIFLSIPHSYERRRSVVSNQPLRMKHAVLLHVSGWIVSIILACIPYK